MTQIYLSDIPRLFTAIAEWCACVAFIQKRPLRFKGIQLWGILSCGLVIQCGFLQLTDGLYIVLWLPCMVGAIGLMFILIAVCCNIHLTSLIYFTACAFLMAEFAASLGWQIYSYIQHTMGLLQKNWITYFLAFVCFAVIYAIVFGVLYCLKIRREDPLAAFIFRAKELWPPVVISVTCFLMSNLPFVYTIILS